MAAGGWWAAGTKEFATYYMGPFNRIYFLPVHFAVFAFATFVSAGISWAQPLALSQPELRAYTEKMIRGRKVAVQPPSVSRGTKTLNIGFGRCETQPITTDEMFNRILDQQFAVTLFRMYRNKPEMAQWWSGTLAQVEQEISGELAVYESPTLTEDQKSQALDAHRKAINTIYDSFFQRWGQKEGRKATWGESAGAYSVKFVTFPPGGQVSYMPAARWELFRFCIARKKPMAKPEWETPASKDAVLAGQFYFYVQFGNKRGKMSGPIEITKEGTLTFTENGFQQN